MLCVKISPQMQLVHLLLAVINSLKFHRNLFTNGADVGTEHRDNGQTSRKGA